MAKRLKTKTALWNKSGKALQAHYRRIGGTCLGNGVNCAGRMEVMHHHFHWSKSMALRLEEINLVRLCTKCHMSYHNGNPRVKINYERAMRERWGQDWEDQLWKIDQTWNRKSAPELRDYIESKLKSYEET